jgi:hypothetical protein
MLIVDARSTLKPKGTVLGNNKRKFLSIYTRGVTEIFFGWSGTPYAVSRIRNKENPTGS